MPTTCAWHTVKVSTQQTEQGKERDFGDGKLKFGSFSGPGRGLLPGTTVQRNVLQSGWPSEESC